MEEFREIVLASGSPRRQQILRHLGIPFRVHVTDVDEWSIPSRNPRDFAIKAAYAKAVSAQSDQPAGSIIVAADTIVVLEQTIFGKPESKDEAREMLRRLAGQVHQVITGVAVKKVGQSTLLDATVASVQFRQLSSAEIADYVETGEPMDKAGAYAAQGIGRTLITQIEGDFFTVIGLSGAKLLEMLGLFADTRRFATALADLTPESLEQARVTVR